MAPPQNQAATDGSLLRAIDLTHRHAGDLLVLDAVNLAVRPGQIYCLLGAAGAGKTAVLHAFAGLLHPSAGRVYVKGCNVRTHPVEARRHLTYIPRGAALYGTLTARQNLQFFVRVDGGGRSLRRADYYNAMRRVGIPERAFERPARELGPAVSLSVWLALGLLKETPVLLVDEPTAGLDVYASAELHETLLEFSRSGKALLVATGDVLLAGRVADLIGIMNEGRKSVELPREEFVGRSILDVSLEYIGRASHRSAEP